MSDKRKVLMIDDEPDLCIMVKTNLESTGEFEVVTSTDPTLAEQICAQEKPDVILLDNVMPNRKGSEIVKAFKSDSTTKHIPIIVVSGKGEMVYSKKKDQFQWLPGNPVAKQRGEIIDEKNPQKAAQQYGAEDYVSKPFTTEVLVGVIKEVLEKYGPKEEDASEGAAP